MIKTMIVDDEPLALEFAEQIISKHKDINVIGTYTNSFECLGAIQKELPHIVFLDIHLPGINGIELAELLLEFNPNIYIVFLTAYEVFAVDAFELDALDYIIKPIKEDRLQKTIDRYLKNVAESSLQSDKDNSSYMEVKVGEYLSFKTGTGNFQAISWRTSKAQELFIYLLQNNGDYIEKETLMELLWESKDLENSASLLYTNIYNVRKTLKQFGNHFKLKNRLNGYVLELQLVKVDVLDWEKTTKALDSINESNISQYENQIRLFQGDYFLNHDYIWLEQKRQSLIRLWKQCIESVIQYYGKEREWSRAIMLLEDVTEQHPSDENVHFLLMKIHGETGNLDAIAAQYRKLIKGLRTDLDISPSTEVQKWYRQNVIKKLTLDIME